MDRILGIGNATVDIVYSLPEYPAENDEVRCDSRVVSRGGNAANTLVVLAGLGYRCSWAGMLSDDAEGRFVQQDLASNGVDTRYGHVSPRGAMPVSTVILSAATGSRTIVHYRDLPEYDLAEFGGIALDLSLIHISEPTRH